MAAIRDIKRKIGSIKSTKQITKAMELVSTSKLRKARERLDKVKPYFHTVNDTVQDILSNSSGVDHPLTVAREVKNSLVIVISADRGLCGGYNINALKTGATVAEDNDNTMYITIGTKARDYFTKRGYNVFKEYIHISEKPDYKDAKDISRLALQLYQEGKVDEIKLVYTEFISTINQEARLTQLLPVEKNEKAVDDSEEQEFKYVSYEPSPQSVLDYLIPKYVEGTIYGALVESAASEQAARRVAMESATDNADDLIDKLTISYNQARQAAITQEISEIVGGAEALK